MHHLLLQPCPNSSRNYRTLQCERLNTRLFGEKYFDWEFKPSRIRTSLFKIVVVVVVLVAVVITGVRQNLVYDFFIDQNRKMITYCISTSWPGVVSYNLTLMHYKHLFLRDLKSGSNFSNICKEVVITRVWLSKFDQYQYSWKGKLLGYVFHGVQIFELI